MGFRTQPPYSNGEVNRAGALLLDLRERMERDGAEHAVGQSDEHQLDLAWAALIWWRSRYAQPLSALAGELRQHVSEVDGRVQGRIEVAQRLKRLPTMIDKLAREKGRVTQMHDIGGVRAVVPSLTHILSLSKRLGQAWTITRVRDYVLKPKPSGYRAVHLIASQDGLAIEVQLRTLAQDFWANMVEEHGRQHGVGFKFGEGDADTQAMFVEMASAMARYDHGEITVKELSSLLQTLS